MDFYALFGRLGGDCSTQKGHAFWSKSVDFYALFGVVGGVCGMEKGYAFWSASVDFHTLFGLVGGVCGAEKGHAFWSKSVDFYAIFGLLGGGRGVEKGQAVRGFRTGMKKMVVWFEPPAGGSDWAALMEGFSWFQKGLRPMLGPCWATKIPNTKRKVLGIYVWAFWGASFESQQKGFPVGSWFWRVLGHVQAYIGPFWGVKATGGAPIWIQT